MKGIVIFSHFLGGGGGGVGWGGRGTNNYLKDPPYSIKLGEVPSWYLDHNIVQAGLKASRGCLGNRVL